MRNLEMAFPEKSEKERKRILRGEFTSLGRQLAELVPVSALHTGKRR